MIEDIFPCGVERLVNGSEEEMERKLTVGNFRDELLYCAYVEP